MSASRWENKTQRRNSTTYYIHWFVMVPICKRTRFVFSLRSQHSTQQVHAHTVFCLGTCSFDKELSQPTRKVLANCTCFCSSSTMNNSLRICAARGRYSSTVQRSDLLTLLLPLTPARRRNASRESSSQKAKSDYPKQKNKKRKRKRKRKQKQRNET